MQIKTIKVGSLQTNCYILIDEKSKQAIIIDPGDEAYKILPEIKGLKVPYVVITHGHPDHFGAVDDVLQATKAKLMMNPNDSWFLEPQLPLKDGDEVEFGHIVLKVIHTPGHSQGGICLYTPGHLFSGDTLFSTTYGRVDLPGSSPAAMRKSLEKLSTLPDETIVYPGHDETTTIGLEKKRGTLVKY